MTTETTRTQIATVETKVELTSFYVVMLVLLAMIVCAACR
jgi:hypothetical protein